MFRSIFSSKHAGVNECVASTCRSCRSYPYITERSYKSSDGDSVIKVSI